MQDEIVPAPESETPGYGPKSEIAPGSLKIVCTPEATGDDNSPGSGTRRRKTEPPRQPVRSIAPNVARNRKNST